LKHNDGTTEDIAVKGVFIAIGHKPNTDIFKGQLDMDETGYLKTKGGTGDNVGATNIEGVWAAGDVILTAKLSPARPQVAKPLLMPNAGSTAKGCKTTLCWVKAARLTHSNRTGCEPNVHMAF